MKRACPVDFRVTVEVQADCPSIIDEVARRAPATRAFLRAAWYGCMPADAVSTIVARTDDGRPFAALPTIAAQRWLPRLRTVAGSYWPFRSPVIAEGVAPDAIAAMIAHPRFRRMLSPLWRMGPVHADDPLAELVLEAARSDGWTVLTRSLGRTWRLDLAALGRDGGWPRKSTLRRLRGYERSLAAHGPVRVQSISGGEWNPEVVETLAEIERNSWLGEAGRARDPKFLDRRRRQRWLRALEDPAIADALSATLLYAGEWPVAFSFDLRAGPVQYSIASSYDRRLAACRPGKIVTYHQFDHALAAGVVLIDLGAGDSGYKREMGAEPGPEIRDHLIIRHRLLAAVLRRWERASSSV